MESGSRDVDRRSSDDVQPNVVIEAGSPEERRSEEEGGGVQGSGLNGSGGEDNQSGEGGIGARSLVERVTGEDGGVEDIEVLHGSGGEEEKEEENQVEEEQVFEDEKDKDASFLKLKDEVAAIQAKPEHHVDSTRADPRLPPRICFRDYYPIGRRVNEFSKPKWVADIAEAIETSPAMKKLLNSQFGALFKIPLRRLAFSGKIVHNLLSRQLWNTNPGELWFLFAGKPIRFALREFRNVTGLKCTRKLEENIVTKKTKVPKEQKSYLKELTGHKEPMKVENLLSLRKNNSHWPDWKNLR